MKPLFWAILNLIGFVSLIFMYSNTDKTRLKNAFGLKQFRFLLVIIMMYLIFDTGMYLVEGLSFPAAKILNYIFTMLFYFVVPLPGLLYLFYCDSKVYGNAEGIKKRYIYYSIPAAINTLAVLATPFTGMVFYISENNHYMRGSFIWLTVLVTFGYALMSYLLLAVKTRNKPAQVFRGSNIYLYLFQIPPLVLAIIQLQNYGPLLVGMGYVISAYFMYFNNIQSSEDHRKLAVRFNNISIAQFAVVSFIMLISMLWALERITNKIAQDYAIYNSIISASILQNYLNREIGVMGTAVNSKVVIEWFGDENNPEKKQAAYDELISTSRALYNRTMYVVVAKSGNEYSIEGESAFRDFQSHASVSAENPDDQWIFDLMAMPYEYNLNVDIDKEFNRKRVWLNYRVEKDGQTLGVICSGMDFSKVAGQALTEYDDENTRILIIDEKGVICMDNTLLDQDDFFLVGNAKTIFEESVSHEFLAVFQTYLDSIDGAFQELNSESMLITLHADQYKYATITPIGMTTWSIVKFFDSSASFGPAKFLLLFIIIAVLFILFVLSTNQLTQHLIFSPIKNLVDSLLRMKESNEQKIYGIERDDEIGLLSNTIQDLFIKGHYDALTGIYNRRYMEKNMRQLASTLSRTESTLSVMMLDVDFFKKYNDTYGHSKGDECLKAIAQTLNRVIMRDMDFVARYGGEEFVVVLPNTSGDGTHLMAEKILEAIRDLKIPHEKNAGGIVTISIGIAMGDQTYMQNPNDFIAKADEALYLSKNNGRNQFTFLAM